ncbi:MAG: hypothetical protein ACJ788_12200 [Ktedonobacteraceae bacterium]
MLNVRCRQWLVMALSLALLLIALFVSGSGQLLAGITPAVMAAGRGVTAAKSDCTNTHHVPSFGGTIVVDTNEIACGNLTTFGGRVAVNGEVQGDIVAFNSDVVIAGKVDGNIDMYGGTVILQSGSHVYRDIHLYGGHWVGGPNTQINGSVIDHTKRVDWLFTDNGAFRFSFWSLLIWLALGVLLTSLLPEHVMLVRTTVVSKTRRSLLIGLLSVLLAPVVLIVLTALVLSIPLAIIVGLGLIAAWALGTVAIGWLVGDYIMRRVAPHRNTRLMQIVVGLTVLVLAGSLPYIGWLISIGVGLLGLGAVFLSRFGTRLYSQPKQPLIL